MAVMCGSTELVAAAHRAIGGFAVTLHPGGQRRPEIEIQRFVVVADMDDGPFHRVGMRVGGVAFAQDALVPIGEGRSARLGADETGPGTFARRLIKVTVNDYVTWLSHLILMLRHQNDAEKRASAFPAWRI